MLQYNIPQFIDSEDKIIGPVTIRQMAYLAIGTVIIGFLFMYKPNIVVFFILAVPIGMTCLAFAFFKINGLNFEVMIANIISFISKPTLMLWSRQIENVEPIIKVVIEKRNTNNLVMGEYSQSKVEELAWLMDTYGQNKPQKIYDPSLENNAQ